MIPSWMKGLVVLVVVVSVVEARSWRQLVSYNFIGEGTNDLATSILQGTTNNNTNYVFSPLGYSVILAVLAEGSRGTTRNQLASALHISEDTFAVRNNYKTLLSRMQERGVPNQPEFKNWFYVYKNYSVETNYKEILEKSYLTEVKYIDYLAVSEPEDQELTPAPESTNKPETSSEEDSSEEETSKPEVEKTPEAISTVRVSRSQMRQSLGTMLKRALNDEEDKELIMALSANRLCTVVEEERRKKPVSRMLVFNGLYFRGNWSRCFSKRSNEDFYISPTEKKSVEMMYTQGEYDIGDIPELDSTAVELPYKGERYSLLVIRPNSKDGVNKLLEDLKGFQLHNINEHLKQKTVEVLLPKFNFQTVSRPKEALVKNGITDIFNENADLSGITGSKGLYLEELVQLVTFEVDEGQHQTNFITASQVGHLSRNAMGRVELNHPFLFFLRDRIDNLIVVAGKVSDPSLTPE